MPHLAMHRSAVLCGGLMVGLAVVTLAATATAAPKVDADFSKYCRTTFPNSVPMRRGIRHFCKQRGSLQGIDLAEACRLTTGSRRYTVSGSRILCHPGKGSSRLTSAGRPDFESYCREKYKRSMYVRRHGRATHLCRQSGMTSGFVLHNISLADACWVTRGTRRYRKIGDRVICLRSKGAGTRIGTYRWPHTRVVYRGQLKNGKPHGIGRNYFPRGDKHEGWTQIGTFHNGKSKGLAYTRTKRGVEFCILVEPEGGIYRTRRMPLARCAHLRRRAGRNR